MEAGKGTRKSNYITSTPTRTAPITSKTQQRERKQEVPKKQRSAMKKDLTDFFGQGKRAPGPTTAGNPIDTVIQHCVLKVGTPTGEGDSRAGAGGQKDDNNSWCTPLVKKKRDKSNTRPRGAEGEERQNTKKPRSDNEQSAGEQSKGTEQAGHTVDLESMSASSRKKSPKTKSPIKEEQGETGGQRKEARDPTEEGNLHTGKIRRFRQEEGQGRGGSKLPMRHRICHKGGQGEQHKRRVRQEADRRSDLPQRVC